MKTSKLQSRSRLYYLWRSRPHIGDVRTVMSLEGQDFSERSWVLLQGGKLDEAQLPRGRLYLARNGVDGDCVHNPLSWPIISDKFRRLLEEIVETDVQFFPAPLWDEITQERISGYWIINVLKRVSCVDMDKSVYEFFPETDIIQSFDKWCLTRELIPDASIFRPDEGAAEIFVTDEIVRLAVHANITGIAFEEVKTS